MKRRIEHELGGRALPNAQRQARVRTACWLPILAILAEERWERLGTRCCA